MSRRERRLLRIKGKKYRSDETIVELNAVQVEQPVHKKAKYGKFLQFYDTNYRKLMWITVVLLIASLIIIGVHTAMTGEFIPRGVSLKGGLTLTVPYEDPINVDDLQSQLRDAFPDASLSVRSMSSAGKQMGVIIDASDVEPGEILDKLRTIITFDKHSIETFGSALGESFFKQTMSAMAIAFVLMSIVVFISFKTFVPSAGVIISAFSDIIMTVAAIDLLGIKIETAGIAALLMLIGYSVDTDILLTTRVLKRQEGTVFDRVIGAAGTGLTMTFTAIAAVLVALIFTQSETLKQIMLILLIGLIFDLLNTWIQNVGILRIYMEHLSKKRAAETLADYKKEDEIVEVIETDEDDAAEVPKATHHEAHHAQHAHNKEHKKQQAHHKQNIEHHAQEHKEKNQESEPEVKQEAQDRK